MTIRLTSELCGSGILLRKETRHRLVLGVRLIQQAAAVEIDVNDVVPA
jgi:transcription termination/antitermination protein NusG